MSNRSCEVGPSADRARAQPQDSLSVPEQCEDVCVHQDRVARVRSSFLDDATADGLAELFSLLGDRTRVRILHALSLGELCVCDLAAVLNVSASAVSHQLRLLRTAKLVRARKEGKNVFYALDDGHVHSLITQGLEHVLE
ncbi:transcriptional regulator, ArsR family [Humidesulfovibrio mexicanus]|uniref:Transcriptional regulator, ArsR family n=1 Tax=Humidesulfovibrio mexicanus TaxID=147047 RepID=A0A238XW73_9BACT|nr:metalloregulator ArsR/SmtB family transcription factor [Humidesulfovibrio mexicanus]SNR62239.1 transcriptional regulator, ArsR family [Humidesulfovibrio mexicanus]